MDPMDGAYAMLWFKCKCQFGAELALFSWCSPVCSDGWWPIARLWQNMVRLQFFILKNRFYIISFDSLVLLKCKSICAWTVIFVEVFILNSCVLTLYLGFWFFWCFVHVPCCLRRSQPLWEGCSHCDDTIMKWPQFKSAPAASWSDAHQSPLLSVCGLVMFVSAKEEVLWDSNIHHAKALFPQSQHLCHLDSAVFKI